LGDLVVGDENSVEEVLLGIGEQLGSGADRFTDSVQIVSGNAPAADVTRFDIVPSSSRASSL
jgi:hypothetical protein